MASFNPPNTDPKLDRILQIALLIFLSILLAIGTVPGYLAGQWQWQNPPAVKTLGELKQIRKQGIPIAGWNTIEQKSIVLGEHPWSIQTIQNSQKETATVFLFTQNGPKDQPQVEWSELNGIQRWKYDSESQQKFTSNQSTITTRTFRAWNPKQTYAVMQWYAWSDGGHPEPSHWFFADRAAQLQGKRQPWIAVTLLLPMEPLDDLNKYRDRITAIAQPIQAQLTQTALKPQ
jgi:cyanoexosortase B-associated protein